jgi:WD40 repeat protein
LQNVSEVNAIAFSLDGSLLAAAVDISEPNPIRSHSATTLVVVDPFDGTPLATWQAHDCEPTGIAILDDGTMLLSSSLDGTVRFWSLPAAFRRYPGNGKTP